MNTLRTLYFTQQISTLRTESCHHPNPVTSNNAGVCQYDITNATIAYSAVSMTPLYPQLKDHQKDKSTRMHHIYSKGMAKGADWPKLHDMFKARDAKHGNVNFG